MTSEAHHIAPIQLGGAPALRLAPASLDDRGYVVSSWLEGNWQAPRTRKYPFRLYRASVEPQIQAIVEHSGPRLLAAYLGDAIVGWLCYEQGKRIDVVHWVHVRYRIGKDGPEMRGKGIMRALFSSAPLRSSICYTHRGPLQKQQPRISSDVWIAKWLADRGVTATYNEKEDWKL